ncbi:MAG TPA: hypothetical protein VJT68_11760 [Thermoleophilaceae bacterium]|nr:hypothetical protein [Thermoleophilaceae bacterium]
MGPVIRLIAIVCSGLVLLGFAFFATDEMSRGSQNQQNALGAELNGGPDPAPVAPTPEEEKAREAIHGTFREGVEDVNDVLLGPFTELVAGSNDRWVTHGIPAILGVLLYGFCLGMLANMLPKGREHGADWRFQES